MPNSIFPTYTYANTSVPNGGYTGNITLTGTGGPYSTATNWTTTATSHPWYTTQPKVKITDSDIEIDGLSLKTTLAALQERMAIMVPNLALEKEFAELKACGDKYRELEREFQEQLRMWNTLKHTDK